MIRLLFVAALASGVLMADTAFDQSQAERFAHMALDCMHKEYPNKISHSLNSDADVKPPRELTPAFYGCYDWHSSVHGHWLLVRFIRLFPQSPVAGEARRAVAQSLTPPHIAQEVKYQQEDGRNSFERPYGMAWLLQLAAELREFDDPQAREWSAALRPLEQILIERLTSWFGKLEHPLRVGEHTNTAFSMGLLLDYAHIAHNEQFGKLVGAKARDFYLNDRNCPTAYEPSGEDFLSPCLAEADLMRRALPEAEFVHWFNRFLPTLDMQPTYVTDYTDGRLYHLAGLNLRDRKSVV